MFSMTELQEATVIVRRALTPTPQIAWPVLGERTGAEVWVKHENHLPTGAFKMRGGLVMMDALQRGKLGKLPAGIISATRGNHGQSLAFAGSRAGMKVVIVAPVNNSREKNAAMRAFGAELIETGRDFDEAREVAMKLAEERNLSFIPSFHRELVRGVATGSLEFLSSVADLDTVYVPIGLGSGICAMTITRDLLNLKTRIVGVVSTHAPAAALSYEAGRVITTETAETFADGVAVRVPNPDAIEIMRKGVERIVQVTDDEVKAALRLHHEATHNMVEGAGATPLAALLKERDRMKGKRVGLVQTGGNIDRDLLVEILAAA